MKTTLGFVGLGQIGAPMAAHLVDWPDGLVVFDVRPEATAELGERGVSVARSLNVLAGAANIISVMVRDDDQVRAVLAGIAGAAAPGTVIAIHSTIRAETAEELAADAAKDGLVVVDAPVSGGFMGAHEGRLAVMVGGPPEDVERCREPFARWATLFVHAGPVGAGTRMKLARNLVTFASYAAATEAQRLAEAAALDLRRLAEVVKHSDAVTGGPASIMFRDTTAPLAGDDPLYDIVEHTCQLGEKDLTLALELGHQLGVELPMARTALERLAPGLGLPS